MLKADTLFYNGKIYTMEEEEETVEALVVYQEKIIYAGSLKEAENYEVREKVDLKGRCVIPGFNDTHCHLAEATENRRRVDLESAKNIPQAVELLKAGLKDVVPGGWLIGYNLVGGYLEEKRLPNRYELDAVSEEIPVFIHDVSLHNYIGNSKVLELTGLDEGYDGKFKQLLVLDENGKPTGNFKEHGLLHECINKVRPSIYASPEDERDAVCETMMEYASLGYTTIQSCDGFAGSNLDKLYTYQKLKQEDRLPIRIILERQTGVKNAIGAISGLGDNWVKYGAVKFFCDGSFNEYSAFLLEPYADRPETSGFSSFSKEEFEKMIREAYEEGNDVAIHVIGDAAVTRVLDIIEKIYKPESRQQFILIHCHLTSDSIRKRMAGLPVVAAMQPVFLSLITTAKFGEKLGAERCKNIHAFKSLMNAGVIVAGGSDNPCAKPDAMFGIWEAVNRISFYGTELNGQEKLTPYEAVSMFTKNAAYCNHEEAVKGTLTEGKLADFIVLDENIFQTDKMEIKNIKVQETYVGGKKVYSLA